MADNFNLRSFLSENKLTKNAQLLKEADETRGAYALVIDEDGNFTKEDLSYYSEESYLDPEGEELSGMEEALNYPDTVSAWQHAPELRDSQDAQWKEAVAELGNSYMYYDVIGDGGENAVIAAIPQGSSLSDYIQDEEDLDEGSYSDTSGYWVMYGGLNKGIKQFIKMFPSEEEAQQALEDAPTTYGQHVLRGYWGIIPAQEWLASGGELGPNQMGHPDRVAPKRLSPEEERASRQRSFDDEMEREGTENNKPTMKETKLTAKERRLVEMVNNAMGFSEGEENPNHEFGTNAVTGEPLPNPNDTMVVEDEMPDETVIPEYKNIEELLKSIEEGTNKVAEEHKIQEMKKIADALRTKAKKMEESEHAAHISPKDLKQLATDAAKLEKAAEKLKSAFDKKFNKKEKVAAAPKAEKVEALQEGAFDLRKFLAENRK